MKRFDTFVNQSMPVISHYDAKGKVAGISAVPHPDAVYEEVKKALGPATASAEDIVSLLGDVLHKEAILKLVSSPETAGSEFDALLQSAIIELLQSGAIVEAVKVAKRAVAQASASDPSGAVTLGYQFILASLLFAFGEVDASVELHTEVLEGRKKTLGEKSKATLGSFHSLGVLLCELEEHGRAIDLLDRAYTGRKAILGTQHKDTVLTSASLGFCLKQCQDFRKAEVVLRECFESSRKVFGKLSEEHLGVSFTLADCLAASGEPGKLSEAEEMYMYELLSAVAAFGEDSMRAVNSLLNLAKFYLQLGRSSSTRTGFIATLQRVSTDLGRDIVALSGVVKSMLLLADPDAVAIAAIQLGDLAGVRSRDMPEAADAAAEYYAMAIDGTRSRPSTPSATPMSPSASLAAASVLIGYAARHSMALLHMSDGNYTAALALLRTVYSGRQQFLGNLPDTFVTAASLGHCLLLMGDFEEAEYVLAGAVKDAKESVGLEHPDVLTLLFNYGDLLLNMARKARDDGDGASADELASKARRVLLDELKGSVKTLGVFHPETIMSEQFSAKHLMAQGRMCELSQLLHDSAIQAGTAGQAIARARASVANVREIRPTSANTSRDDIDAACDEILVGVLYHSGALSEAADVADSLLARRERSRGKDSPEAHIARFTLGSISAARGDTDRGIALLRETLDGQRAALGNDAPDVQVTANNLAYFLLAAIKEGRGSADAQEVLVMAQSSLDSLTASLGRGHAVTLTAMFNVGEVLRFLSKEEEAIALLSEEARLTAMLYGKNSPQVAASEKTLFSLGLSATAVRDIVSVSSSESSHTSSRTVSTTGATTSTTTTHTTTTTTTTVVTRVVQSEEVTEEISTMASSLSAEISADALDEVLRK